MPASAAEHSLRGRAAAHAKWARTSDRMAATAPGRAAAATALERRWIEEYGLDPDAPDFAKRLASARSAHYARLALRSAETRRRKKARRAAS